MEKIIVTPEKYQGLLDLANDPNPSPVPELLKKEMATAKTIAELRSKTGAGVMACKKALETANGNFDIAVEHLLKNGEIKALKLFDREMKEGLVHSYIHLNGKIGVLVEVNCETDFVAKTEAFKTFVNDVALHITAMNSENEETLLQEQFIKDQNKTIKNLCDEKIAEFGENIKIRRFSYFKLNE